MARERMVTRTITFQEYKFLCLNLTDKTVFEAWCSDAIPERNDKRAFERMQEILNFTERADARPVAITEHRQAEQKYGMTEADFMRYGHVID